jgi:DNA invertase Pin-like site-specific DNA recombinase
MRIATGDQIDSCVRTWEFIMEKHKALFEAAARAKKAKPSTDRRRSTLPALKQPQYDKVMALLARNDGLSQTAIAEMSGVSRSSVRLIKLGLHPLSPKSKTKTKTK